MRLRLLLDSLTGAAQGIRRELALPPSDQRPGDLVEGGRDAAALAPTAQGRAADDPAFLDRLLGVPGIHMIIDGYNVTKTGYGGLALEQQRDRLVAGVAGLAARTGAEVTVVFDGGDRGTVAASAVPRGVRVRFSDPGVIADQLIARFVAEEPEGRPLVVVSTDGEVAAHARSRGAYSVPSIALVRLLDRS
jgi:predicted RNA-binding protein with PIN domain